ncbi:MULTISPECIES: 4-carboxymuconolactone decarboxylase [unclassified Microbacterium]|uniref:4-carboxymuconolactone decarboxylase n=1 Tax=unclassified Microbacterium TaxID=2609290 RepID=UPI000EB4D15B|nr:4-carboxymuconolactone decarboxylase [Microbacterium sp. AG1240]RKT33533.1 4-carboxymuconolactone decarboxylase [Microbacterium sp. AG1240]
MAAEDLYELGLAKRKKVLGAQHVERSLEAASDFTRDVQELVTEYCWGAVWTRDGLDDRTRSMLNLAMLTALNRGHELGVHVRGAITNGVTEQEIKEVLMQTAIYCGVPAALESFRIAESTLSELRAADD